MNALIPATIQHDDLETIQRTAKLLAVSGYFDAKGETPMAIAQIATKILAGRELGFGPFAAVNGIHIIQGKPAVGANLMASAVKGSGHYDYRVKTMTDAEVAIEFFAVASSKRESLGVSSFTTQDAQAAGLTSNPTWKKFARNMLFARAMSNGVRWYCPDVFSGNAVYVPEELGANVDPEGNVVDAVFRAIDATTGEITSPTAAPARNAAPGPATLATRASTDVEPPGDVLFERAWYAAALLAISNTNPYSVFVLCDDLLILHRNNGGPCSPKAYGYLAGLLDSIIKQATGAEDGHKRVLAVLCQMDVTGDNRPSATMAGRLLARLATHIKDDTGAKVINPNYDQPTADAMVAIYRAAENVGTPSLLETIP